MRQKRTGLLVRLTVWLIVCGAAPAVLQAQAAAPRAARQSWTADRRALTEGDVLTVVLDEYTSATQHSGNAAHRSRSRSADLAASQDVVRGGIVPTLAGAGVVTDTRGDSRERGDAVRENTFVGEITVRVVGAEPNGMLRIQGSKRVNVDKSAQEIAISGLVRPEDISSANVVESWRIADLELRYNSKGSLSRPKGGILSRILEVIWP
jgi:flagellar L-ring protein precursor FlgH